MSIQIKTLQPYMLVAILLAIFAYHNPLQAQALDYNNRVSLELRDGTAVVLYGRANTRNNEANNDFFYLPTNLKLSRRPDGVPEFVFLKYTTEEQLDAGGVQGALMHFLMHWGLSRDQVSEAEQQLAGMGYKNPKVKGAADVFVDNEKSFRIISASLNDPSAQLITSGMAPPLPGSKVAVASKMDKNTAQLLAATFEKSRSITDVSIEMIFQYNVLLPAVNGNITIHWDRVDSLIQSVDARYTRNDRDTKTDKDDRYTLRQMDSLYKVAQETKAVEVSIDKLTTDDATADMVVEQFLNVFVEALTERDMDAPPSAAGNDLDDFIGDNQKGAYFKLDKDRYELRIARQTEVYNLNYRTTITKTMTVTANLGEWYDGVRDNPRCVASINLNDPFFQHRDINFILDLDAADMFDTEVNYVTVNVRKQRDEGNDFSEKLTIDKQFIEQHGVKAVLSYARGEDSNPDLYQYQTQWSLRGGEIYPDDPPWIEGAWEGVTLTPPVKPVMIRFETDLDEMEALDLRNVTLQLRYIRFGKETESNVNISLYSQDPFAERTIFLDKDTKGYAYRMVFTHKEKGIMAMPWESKINTNYVFAVIPEELKQGDENFIAQAIEEGRQVLLEMGSQASKEVAQNQQVLDKFKDLIQEEN